VVEEEEEEDARRGLAALDARTGIPLVAMGTVIAERRVKS